MRRWPRTSSASRSTKCWTGCPTSWCAASARVWRCEGEHIRRGAAQLGGAKGGGEEETLQAGEERGEGRAPESVLAGVSSAMPALLEAYKLSSRAAHVGFEWPDIDGLFDKLHEETERAAGGVEGMSGAGTAADRRREWRNRVGTQVPR